MNYRDEHGGTIQIGNRLGRGGEGTAYLVANRPSLAVKLYDLQHSNVTEELIAKLDALIALANGDVQKLSAWPQSKVVDSAGRVCGFTMLAVRDHRPFHDVLTPKSRKQHFPEADWRFLIHTAGNLARAFGAVHATGAVLADVNAQNLLVSADATVKIIDCDSFQISSANRVFRCTVRTDDYTPPELQDADFRDVIRSQNHDAFGLAVLIFQLLMMGRHPYAGRSLRTTDGLIPTAIKDHRFAYGPGAAARGMSAPDGTLRHEALGSQIWALFETAFAPPNSVRWRPRAKDWLEALGDLGNQVKGCTRRPEHAYLRSLPQCPWCAMAAGPAQTAVFFLPRPIPQAPPFDAAACLAAAIAVQALENVNEKYDLPTRPPHPGKHWLVRWFPTWSLAYDALFGFLVFTGGSIASGGLSGAVFGLAITLVCVRLMLAQYGTSVQRDREVVYELACKPNREVEQIHAMWMSPPSDQRYFGLLGELESAHALLVNLAGYRTGQLSRAADRDRAGHLRRHLEAHRVAPGVISGVGDARASTLIACGIRSAADVSPTRLGGIPGFGPALSGNVLAWRRGIESGFRLDPLKVLSSYEIAAIDSTVQRERVAAETLLRDGAAARRQLVQLARQEREENRILLVAALDRFRVG